MPGKAAPKKAATRKAVKKHAAGKPKAAKKPNETGVVKPTVRRCMDGKDHHWLVVNEDTDVVKKTRWERRWCEKCGVLTQVTIDDEGKATVLLSGRKPHLVVPKILKAIT